MIRVVLPAYLRILAGTGREVELDLDPPVSVASIVGALEQRYPVLLGAIRDRQTGERRPFIRYFACEEDLSHDDPNDPLPEAVATGTEPLVVLGAMAGG